MPSEFQKQTFTIHKDHLISFKEFCTKKHWTLSRFLVVSGEEKLEREKKEGN